MRKIVIILFALGMLMSISNSAQAISMQALLDAGGGEIFVGDKRFFNFNFDTLFNTGSAAFPDLSAIEVTGISDSMNPGLLFEAGDELTVEGIGSLFLEFFYRVEVLDPNFRIKDVSVDLISGVIGPGPNTNANGDHNPSVVFDEFIIDPGSPAQFAALSAFANLTASNTVDSAEFAPQEEIIVGTEIRIGGEFEGDFAGLTRYEQRFSQVAVPEPAILFLVGMGLIGVIIVQRKYRKQYIVVKKLNN